MSLNKLTDQQSLIHMMGKLMKEIKGIINQELSKEGINLSKEQVIVLKKLVEQDGRPQNDLAVVTSRDKTSLSRLLATMENKDLITRKQSHYDKRINLVFITHLGITEFNKAKPIAMKIINQAIKGVDLQRIDQTKILLSEIYENLNLQNEE
jgi:DNA-binding MarR family transcriptional regulator